MQTATAPPRPAEPPSRLTPWRAMRDTWRWLRTMRTALILLFVLAAGASVGSLFPQRPVNAFRVSDWISAHPSWAPLAERFGLFDVYGSWWFTTIYVLLLVSVVGCIVPRYRSLFRQLRSRPRTDGPLDGLPQYRATLGTSAPEKVLDDAARIMRKS